jgi:hypothetical protein
MLATARRSKSLFIHACLHAAMIRCVTRLPAESELGDDETQSKSAYEMATGKKYVLEALRVWGANAYGTLMPEQRKMLRLDKADPTSVPGIYIGNRRDTNTFLILTPGKVHSMGAAMIDEKQLLKNMPVSEEFENEFTDIIEEVRGSDYVFSHDGDISASVTDSSVTTTSGETAAPETDREVEEPAAATRPKRTVQPIARLADEAPKPQLAKSDAPTIKTRRKVMIPRSTWPRYPCTENGGAGWTAEVVAEKKNAVKVSFTVARDVRGNPWGAEWMKPEMLEPLPGSAQFDAEQEVTREKLNCHALAIADSPAPIGASTTDTCTQRSCDAWCIQAAPSCGIQT